ncbi:hypothetical protein GCM10009548_64580 [Streptomyces malaysiensis subsp. malaysiensis]
MQFVGDGGEGAQQPRFDVPVHRTMVADASDTRPKLTTDMREWARIRCWTGPGSARDRGEMILFLASRPIVPRPSHTTPPPPRRRPPRVQSIARALLTLPGLHTRARDSAAE